MARDFMPTNVAAEFTNSAKTFSSTTKSKMLTQLCLKFDIARKILIKAKDIIRLS